jgi:hypothetical protein
MHLWNVGVLWRHILEGCNLQKIRNSWNRHMHLFVRQGTVTHVPVYWDVAPCSLVNIDAYLDGGGSKHIWNVGKFLRYYTVQHSGISHLHFRSRENLKSHKIYQVIFRRSLHFMGSFISSLSVYLSHCLAVEVLSSIDVLMKHHFKWTDFLDSWSQIFSAGTSPFGYRPCNCPTFWQILQLPSSGRQSIGYF